MRGLALVNIYADDVDAARRWYAEVLGFDAYFERPGYAEFRIGDLEHELGIIDRRYAPPGEPAEPGGSIAYWHVDDLEATFARLLDLGAREHRPITAHGDAGFVTASVVDPFGNLLGVMTNPHFLEMVSRRREGAAGTEAA